MQKFQYIVTCAIYIDAEGIDEVKSMYEKEFGGEMMSKFVALLYRMKYILRWSLMRNTSTENIAEHSYYTATIAHILAVISRDIFKKDINPDRVAVCALYHDTGEILTGDMPTPIKYLNPEIRDVYKKIEESAAKKLINDLPSEIKPAIADSLEEKDSTVLRIVKAADKLSAYLKCIEEREAGNRDFVKAESQTLEALNKMEMEEVKYFIRHFIPAFSLTLDELE